MGLGLGRSSNKVVRAYYPSGPVISNYTTNVNNITMPPNPNPSNYTIVDKYEKGDMFAIKVNYPDCTNYEGNKILLFRGKFLDLLKQKLIDPHFCDDKTLMFPIARFCPDKQGWDYAKRFVNMYGRVLR